MKVVEHSKEILVIESTPHLACIALGTVAVFMFLAGRFGGAQLIAEYQLAMNWTGTALAVLVVFLARRMTVRFDLVTAQVERRNEHLFPGLKKFASHKTFSLQKNLEIDVMCTGGKAKGYQVYLSEPGRAFSWPLHAAGTSKTRAQQLKELISEWMASAKTSSSHNGQ